MSEGTNPAAASTSYPEFDRLIGESRGWLAERGETLVGSGCFHTERLSGSIHTDFGPLGQDKVANQDYVLAWWPHAAETRRRLRFVLAMADGLTTSFRSEYASSLACWVAVRALAEAGPAAEPEALARYAFNEAGLTIGKLADELASEPEASCPAGQFLSTWKYILKKGSLFQTTLTLAWLDRSFLRIAMLGDGGALWRQYPAAPARPRDQVLAACDLENQHVFALGPADRSVRKFDCWREEELNGRFLCALHTDGVGRGLGHNPLGLLDALDDLQGSGVENPAQRFIEQAIAEHPKEFDDNLTLAVIRAE